MYLDVTIQAHTVLHFIFNHYIHRQSAIQYFSQHHPSNSHDSIKHLTLQKIHNNILQRVDSLMRVTHCHARHAANPLLSREVRPS